jgi:hypothetical protein
MEAKEILANSLVEYYIKNKITSTGICPTYSDMLGKQTTKLEEIFTPNSIPELSYKSISSLSKYSRTLDEIQMLLSSLTLSMTDIIREHRKLSDSYQDIVLRIDNESKVFSQMINSLLSYSCFWIDTSPANQLDTSIVGKIGKYVTLPFFINGVQMYNGSIFIRPISSGDIVFSNLETITSLPFVDWPSMKLSGTDSNAEVTFNMSINSTTGNAIYLKFLNSVLDCIITLYDANTIVWTGTYHTSEIFANFLPVKFNMISVKVVTNNPNTAKPLAIQLRSLEIFKRIQFAKRGTFESKAIYLEEASRVSYVGTQYSDAGNTKYTVSQPLISVSTDNKNMSYSLINQGDFINISYFKYKHSKMFNLNDITIGTQTLGTNAYHKIPILNTSPMWTMNYRLAQVFHGLNVEYAKPDPVYYSFYENWTKVGNFYKTQLLNYEDGISVDIGQKTCIFNGRQVTGKIKIPVGVSLIEVHSKDIDFKYGNKIADTKYNGIIDKATVYSDPLFPFNFTYMFAGMPEYDGNVLADKPTRRFDITNATTLFLDEPFIPMTVEVTDGSGARYDLQLTKGVSTPRTFSIEPYSGKIRVYPDEDTTTIINVTYRKASLMRRPCGILFNRLLTFIPLKALIGLPDKDDTLFSIDGTPTQRYLLIQRMSGSNINHSYIMYNKFTDKIYAAMKIDMRTDNQSLSPIISDVYITTG